MKKIFFFLILFIVLSINAKVVIVELEYGNKIAGNFKSVIKNTIYLENATVLYSIPYDIVINIQDQDGNNLTLEDLKNFPQSKINFNHYKKIITEDDEVMKHNITTIYDKDFNPYSENTQPEIFHTKYSYTYPNRGFLFVSILSAVVAIDFFNDAHNLKKLEDLLDNDSKEKDILKKRRISKTVSGIISSSVSIGSLFYSIKEVRIEINPQKIEVSYKF